VRTHEKTFCIPIPHPGRARSCAHSLGATMKLESFRDPKTGSIRVDGEGFSVTVQPDGRVALAGSARLTDLVDLMLEQNSDTPSPRSKSSGSRKRGSR
jgi:hypothetical protein